MTNVDTDRLLVNKEPVRKSFFPDPHRIIMLMNLIGFFDARVYEDAPMLEEHARSHEEGEQCPLCSDRTLKLTEHLIQEHKIAESAVERLLAVHRPETS
ncbi:hypothetical protein TELCIR_26294, partial [Teladorsagia circumcincta]